MKKIIMIFSAAILFAAGQTKAQSTEVTPANSWLKAGLNVGVPVGNASHNSNFLAG